MHLWTYFVPLSGLIFFMRYNHAKKWKGLWFLLFKNFVFRALLYLSFAFAHSFYLRTYVHLCFLLIWLTPLNFDALFRYPGKWCCKCITFCIPCQEMKRTLIPIISMEYIDWFSYLCLSYKRAIYWENWGWCFSCVFSVSLG
jgi:hypothetical protein